jgi:hypothetical protein
MSRSSRDARVNRQYAESIVRAQHPGDLADLFLDRDHRLRSRHGRRPGTPGNAAEIDDERQVDRNRGGHDAIDSLTYTVVCQDEVFGLQSCHGSPALADRDVDEYHVRAGAKGLLRRRLRLSGTERSAARDRERHGEDTATCHFRISARNRPTSCGQKRSSAWT